MAVSDTREQEIRERAYRIWQDEGEPTGRDQDHWSKAQAEVEGSANADELINNAGDDLPFGEPEDTGAADATIGTETPDTSGIAAAAQTPLAPAPASSKKASGKAST